MPFQKGNQLAKTAAIGPHNKAFELRDDLIKKVRARKDEINNALIKKAIGGETHAIKEIFDRTVGKSTEYVDITSGGNPIIYVDPIIAQKNGLAPSAKGDS